MYSGLFGALTNEHQLDIIANNLANVNTVGYKQNTVAFQDMMFMYAHEVIRQPVVSLEDKEMFPPGVYLSKVRIGQEKVDFTQGSTKQTGNALDVAIAGDGFFKVRTDVGDFYSRNGEFNKGPDGTLMTQQGFPVLDEGGAPIVIPDNGEITIDEQGQIWSNGENLAQLGVVTVSDPDQLEKYGYNMFRLKDGSDATEAPAEDAQVMQGYLEMPNVNVVREMVRMIETHRAFEAYQKVMTSTQELDQQATQKVGKSL